MLPFELPLLAQSVIMIAAQLTMLHLCVGMRELSVRHKFRGETIPPITLYGSHYLEALSRTVYRFRDGLLSQ